MAESGEECGRRTEEDQKHGIGAEVALHYEGEGGHPGLGGPGCYTQTELVED